MPLALLLFIVSPNVTSAQAAPLTVFTLAYLDETPVYDVDQLNQQFMADLRLASRWHGYDHPANPAALNYQVYGGHIIYRNLCVLRLFRRWRALVDQQPTNYQ
jgi:hypothetical protein